MPSDEQRIEEIRARADAATAGPWGTWPDGTEESVESLSLGRFVCHLNSNMREFREDSAFIAHAREDIPYLLAQLAASEAARAALVEAFVKHRTARHEVAPKFCKTCRESDAAIALAAQPAAPAPGERERADRLEAEVAALREAGDRMAECLEGSIINLAEWEYSPSEDALDAWRALARPGDRGEAE